MKEVRPSSPITLRSLFLYCKAELAFYFLLFFGGLFVCFFGVFFWVFFHEYHDLKDSRGRGRLSLYILSTTSFRFTDTQILAKLLLQRTHRCVQLAAGLKSGTFGFLSQVANHSASRFLNFSLSTLALVADAVRDMLKTRVTLGNISLVLVNLIKRFIFAMFNVHAVNIHIFSLVYQLWLRLALTFVPLLQLFVQCLDMYFQLGRVYLRNIWGLH